MLIDKKKGLQLVVTAIQSQIENSQVKQENQRVHLRNTTLIDATVTNIIRVERRNSTYGRCFVDGQLHCLVQIGESVWEINN